MTIGAGGFCMCESALPSLYFSSALREQCHVQEQVPAFSCTKVFFWRLPWLLSELGSALVLLSLCTDPYNY